MDHLIPMFDENPFLGKKAFYVGRYHHSPYSPDDIGFFPGGFVLFAYHNLTNDENYYSYSIQWLEVDDSTYGEEFPINNDSDIEDFLQNIVNRENAVWDWGSYQGWNGTWVGDFIDPEIANDLLDAMDPDLLIPHEEWPRNSIFVPVGKREDPISLDPIVNGNRIYNIPTNSVGKHRSYFKKQGLNSAWRVNASHKNPLSRYPVPHANVRRGIATTVNHTANRIAGTKRRRNYNVNGGRRRRGRTSQYTTRNSILGSCRGTSPVGGRHKKTRKNNYF